MIQETGSKEAILRAKKKFEKNDHLQIAAEKFYE